MDSSLNRTQKSIVKIFIIIYFLFYYLATKAWPGGGYNIPYFSKSNILAKSNIIESFTDDYDLKDYIPDRYNPSTVIREFLLSLLFNVKRDKYLTLYNTYKRKKIEQSTTSGKIYEIDANSSFASELNKYITVLK